MVSALTTTLLNRLASLKGREVFCVYCGASTGSVLDIHVTPICPRPKALENTTLTQLQREYMGTLSLFVECTWRLQCGDTIVAASGDSLDNAEEVVSALRRLEGMGVTNVILPVLDQVLDLTICFQDGLQLALFCDSGVTQHDNYTLFDENEALTVICGREVRVE